MKAVVPLGQSSNGVFRPENTIFGSLQREIDRLFDGFTRGVTMSAQSPISPNMDIIETDKEILITAELPGLEQKDVQITVEHNVLTVRGEKKAEHEEQADDKNYRLVERSYGAFFRSIQLPPGVDTNGIEAKMSNGVLRITVPKPAKAEAKKVEVKAAA